MDLWMENKPSNSELCTVLEKLIKSWEMEVVEFKRIAAWLAGFRSKK